MKTDWIIGREADKQTVVSLLDQYDVATIVGPPGVGKSALALLVSSTFERVKYIDTTSHDALNFELNEPFDLLVFDDAEGLKIQSSIARLREQYRVLVTSRVPLQMPREAIHRLGGLRTEDAIELIQNTSNRMGVELSCDDMLTFVTAVDFNPLAIELSANKLATLPASKVISNVTNPNFLVGANYSRYQSLSASFTATVDRLSNEEKTCLFMLFIFGAPVEIEVIAGLNDGGQEDLASIHRLLEQGLIDRVGSTVRIAKLANCIKPEDGSDIFLSHFSQSCEAIVRAVQPLLPGVRLGQPDEIRSLFVFAEVLQTLARLYKYELKETLLEAYAWVGEFIGFDEKLLAELEQSTTDDMTIVAIGCLWHKHHRFDDARRCFERARNQENDFVKVELMYLDARFGKVRPDFETTSPIVAARKKVASLIGESRSPDALLADSERYRDAVKSVRVTGDVRWQLRAQMLHAIYSAAIGDFDDAVNRYAKAEEISDILGSEASKAIAVRNTMSLNIRRGKHAEAFAAKLRYPTTLGAAIASDYVAIGLAQLELGRWGDAETNIREGIELVGSLNHDPPYLDQYFFALSSVQFCRTGLWNTQEFQSDRYRGLQHVAQSFQTDIEPNYDIIPADEPIWMLREIYQSEDEPLKRVEHLKHAYQSKTSFHSLGVCSLSNLDHFYQRLGNIEYITHSNQWRAGFGIALKNGKAIRTPSGEWKLVEPSSTFVMLIQTLFSNVEAVSDDVLFEIVWPDDKSAPTALMSRLKVLVSQIRKLGFDVERTNGGYRIPTPTLLFSDDTWEWTRTTL